MLQNVIDDKEDDDEDTDKVVANVYVNGMYTYLLNNFFNFNIFRYCHR